MSISNDFRLNYMAWRVNISPVQKITKITQFHWVQHIDSVKCLQKCLELKLISFYAHKMSFFLLFSRFLSTFFGRERKKMFSRKIFICHIFNLLHSNKNKKLFRSSVEDLLVVWKIPIISFSICFPYKMRKIGFTTP